MKETTGKDGPARGNCLREQYGWKGVNQAGEGDNVREVGERRLEEDRSWKAL